MKRQAVLAAALALLAWTIQDIAVWYVFIERRHLDHNADLGAIYQQLHQLVLLALVVVGVLWLRARPLLAVWFTGTTWTLAYSGLCDVAYYALAGRGQPGGGFPWLDGSGHLAVLFHPAATATLLLSAGAWVTVWISLLALSFPTGRLAWQLRSWRRSVQPGSPRLAASSYELPPIRQD